MSDKATAEIKAPAPEIVEKAAAKQDAGEDLSAREAKALEAQAAIDAERGYRRILLHPAQGIYVWQDAMGLHTTPDGDAGEAQMRAWLNEYRLSQIGG